MGSSQSEPLTIQFRAGVKRGVVSGASDWLFRRERVLRCIGIFPCNRISRWRKANSRIPNENLFNPAWNPSFCNLKCDRMSRGGISSCAARVGKRMPSLRGKKKTQREHKARWRNYEGNNFEKDRGAKENKKHGGWKTTNTSRSEGLTSVWKFPIYRITRPQGLHAIARITELSTRFHGNYKKIASGSHSVTEISWRLHAIYKYYIGITYYIRIRISVRGLQSMRFYNLGIKCMIY